MAASASFFAPRWRNILSQSLRLGLPLGALVLMSTIFLASRNVDPNRAVALSDLDLDALTREPRIGTARIATVTDSAAAVVISAASIRSIADPRVQSTLALVLEQPDGHVDFANGSDVLFSSVTGHLDQALNVVVLDQNVALHTSDGYNLTLQTLHADLNDAILRGTGPVDGTGPAGTLRANHMVISPVPDTSGGYLLAFTGDVRLVYSIGQ
jgi:lipopolysaccharide export system protein LptC